MPTQKNGLDKVASGIGAVRKVLQDLVAPELREHSAILRRHGENFEAIIGLLHEHAVLLRQHGERLAKIEGRLEGIDGRVLSVENRLDQFENRLDHRLSQIEARLDQALEVRERIARSKAA